MITAIQKFITEVIVELKKVSWTSRRDLIESTWIVLASTAALGVFIGVVDFVLLKIMGTLIR